VSDRILFNNAALELQRRFHTIDVDEIDTLVRVDLVVPIALTRLLLPQMLRQAYGRIINISSIAGHVGFRSPRRTRRARDGLIAFSRVLRRLCQGGRDRICDHPRRRQTGGHRPADHRRAREGFQSVFMLRLGIRG
jgi:NAD(P)-dependent dehydrogenase (short-subunit alcohol dehydrogenase family)